MKATEKIEMLPQEIEEVLSSLSNELESRILTSKAWAAFLVDEGESRLARKYLKVVEGFERELAAVGLERLGLQIQMGMSRWETLN